MIHLQGYAAQCFNHHIDLHYHRSYKVWDAIEGYHLHSLGVDENQPHLSRCGLHQETGDNAVKTDRFAAPGSPGDEDMRHLGNVSDNRFPGSTLSQGHHKFGFGPGFLKDRAFDNVAERDQSGTDVGDLDPHQRLPRNRCFNAHVGNRQSEG